MSRHVAARLTWFIAGFGVLAIAVCGTAPALRGGAMQLRYGFDAAASAAAGSAVALGNWFLLRLIVDRVIGGSVRKQAGLTFLLMVKMGALIGLVFLLLRSGFVQVLPFTAGISSLMLGAIFGSFVHVLTAKPVESER